MKKIKKIKNKQCTLETKNKEYMHLLNILIFNNKTLKIIKIQEREKIIGYCNKNSDNDK